MRAATTRGFGLKSALAIKHVSKPSVGPNDVLIEVYASSVNPKDWKLNQNLSSLIPSLSGYPKPLIMGDDLAGVIIEKGAKVKGFDVGDEVYGMTMNITRGACAEYSVMSQNRIAHKPKNTRFKQAASVPLAALTALQAFRLGGLKADKKVLIIGASGGVGTFAVQIAKVLGAQVTAVCSGKNTELVKALGADVVIDYTVQHYLDEKDNFDMIFDVTSYQSLSSCSSLLKKEGIYVTTGGYAMAYLNLIKDNILIRNKRSIVFFVDSNHEDLNTLRQYIEEGKVTPVIDGEYSLEQIGRAYARSKSGRAVGKIVIVVKDEKK